MKRYQSFREASCRSCKKFRKDTEQCVPGCSPENVEKGNKCPFDIYSDNPSELQSECKCYQ